MNLNKTILYAAGGFLTVAFAGLLTAPRVSAAIRATFVEVVIPSTPFYGKMRLTPQAYLSSIGPDTGTLGITNIIVTNFDATTNEVFIFAPLFAGAAGCGSAVTGGTSLNFTIVLQPHSTQTISYPTPLVWGPIQGHSCIGASIAANVEVDVNGFIN
jgi:hypothetical protein